MAAIIQTAWYDLFSRGASDSLRHNSKVREAVRAHLPNMLAGPDVISGAAGRTVRVPVDTLGHARFRLASARVRNAVGQGAGQRGDLLCRGQSELSGESNVGADHDDGHVKLVFEFAVDDIVDWLWQEMKLPELKALRCGDIAEYTREIAGWDRHGARSRLDRRRTLKEAIKRRAVQTNPVAFSNADLRFRQLVHRPTTGTSAVIFFVIDVSASMAQVERGLAKLFFFFALQGLRRQYGQVEARFIAHTTNAWEFPEADFYHVSGVGGTLASSAFRLALGIIGEQIDVAHSNIYLFYASDGENFTEDRGAASQALYELGGMLNFIGYVETLPGMPRTLETETRRLCSELGRRGSPISSSVLAGPDDVWNAIRQFFMQQSQRQERAT